MKESDPATAVATLRAIRAELYTGRVNPQEVAFRMGAPLKALEDLPTPPATPDDEPISLDAIPDGACVLCGGAGHLFNIDRGRKQYLPCWGCDGEATAGVYVIRVEAGSLARELDWHGRAFKAAVCRASRTAVKVAFRLAARGQSGAVKVVFLGSDGRPGETVYRVPVGAVPGSLAGA